MNINHWLTCNVLNILHIGPTVVNQIEHACTVYTFNPIFQTRITSCKYEYIHDVIYIICINLYTRMFKISFYYSITIMIFEIVFYVFPAIKAISVFIYLNFQLRFFVNKIILLVIHILYQGW